MKEEDYATRTGGKHVVSDLERGVRVDSLRPLNSWSSYLSPGLVQFRTPVYSDEVCPAPQLNQSEFPSEPTGDKQTSNSHRVTAHRAHSKCFPPSSGSSCGEQDITPGILRPEEQYNYLGRCRHHDNRYHNILDVPSVDVHRNGSAATDDIATLVGSPLSKQALEKQDEEFDIGRLSLSSCSSYSSQAGDDEAAVSTRRLIRYYTSVGSDRDDGILTSTSRFSPVRNPWIFEELRGESRHPLQAHPTERLRQGSLPPPYQQPSQKSSLPVQEHFKPNLTTRQRHYKHSRQPKLSNDIIEKNVYVLKLCKAFLLFGIQAHRLEEYLHTTSACLEITAEFQYIPHCMLVVLTNPDSATNEVHLLKESTSVDLGKLEDVYKTYELVVQHGQDLQLSIRQLDSIIRRRKMHTNLLLILLHGIAALCAGTFAFSARPIDFGPLFVFGCLLAILQLIVLRTPIRNSHILEVLTCVIVTFAARGLGSIYVGGGPPLFCFSGITQGTIALILPGHIILAAIHEIQHRRVLSGSIKMVYAILYTLFLGFGILIGAALFGFIDHNATDAITCELPWYWNTLSERWRATYSQFVWVPIFALAISIMHQAKKKHLTAMVFIATCGHQAFYWSLFRFGQNLQFAGLIAAFASGLLANLYAYVSGCLAATILLPAVLVQIPNALAASGGLVAGVDTADAIVTNQTYHVSGGLFTGSPHRRDFMAEGPSGSTGLIVTAGFGMAQATIGITVGLFLSAFVVWPFTRRRTDFLGF